MKVLIVSSGLPSKRYPLNGVFAYDQAKALASTGIEVFFFSVDLRSIRKIRKWGLSSSERDGVKCYEYSIPIGPLGIGTLDFFGCKAVNILFSRVFHNKPFPDIIHTHFASSFGACLSKKYEIPLVITEHSSEMNRENLPVAVIEQVKQSYLCADVVITVSSMLASSLLHKTGVKCRVVHNIIDTKLFSSVPKLQHSEFTFVTTALLSERKRIHRIILALKACPDNTRLIIVGDGAERARLETLIKDNCLENRVEMKGLLTREQTAEVYANCDCFVLPSALETFGVVYVEAMAAGLPVIATRCGGPEDFVNEQNGILIDVDNQEQLEGAMKRMIKEAHKYSRSEIIGYVQNHFSPAVIAKELTEIYTEIVK